MSLRGRAGSLLLIVLALLFGGSAEAKAVVLGSPGYIPSGTGMGWGEERPSTIFNGGSPSGLVREIEWRNWGAETVYGKGRFPIYHPAGNYYPPVPIKLRAREIGLCPGESQLAYKVLEFRTPLWPGAPLGPWLKWSGSMTICSYSEQDPRYDYPREPPGICGYTGELGTTYGTPGHVSDIRSFRVDCRRARKLALASRGATSSSSNSRCARRGCRKSLQRFDCRWHRLHSDERSYDILEEIYYPVQRVECHRKKTHVTWWYYLSP